MARWTAKCWLGSASGYQDCEVSANTIGGAKEQLQRIYGAEQIINLRELRNSNSRYSSSSSLSGGDTLSFLGFIGVAYIIYKFWNFFVIGFWIGVGVFSIWLIYKIIKFFLK